MANLTEAQYVLSIKKEKMMECIPLKSSFTRKRIFFNFYRSSIAAAPKSLQTSQNIGSQPGLSRSCFQLQDPGIEINFLMKLSESRERFVLQVKKWPMPSFSTRMSTVYGLVWSSSVTGGVGEPTDPCLRKGKGEKRGKG